MAELALVRFSLKLVWGLVSNRVISNLEHGDFADEKIRQLLLTEFRKIHESLNALRRKELSAATAFMENGYELLREDLEEAKREFNKARDSAQVAFGVVQDSQDKVLATKIMVASALHEFEDKPQTATSLCVKYICRLNSLPEVQKACAIMLGLKFGGKLRAMSSTSNRESFIGAVSEINRCVWQFVKQKPDGDIYMYDKEWPSIQCGSQNFNPVTDFIFLRRSAEIGTLPQDCGTPIAMAVAQNKLFFAQTTNADVRSDQLIGNSIKVLDLDTKTFTNLVGHTGCVLSIMSLDDRQVVTGSMDKTVLVWDASTLKCLQILSGHEGSVRALGANVCHIFSASTDCTVKVWDRNTFELVHTLEGHKAPIAAISVSNRHLFSYGFGEGVIYWDLKKWDRLHNIPVTGVVSSLHIVRNTLVLHCVDELRILNLGNLRECGKLTHAGNMSFALNSSICCTCNSGSELKMWDVSLLKCIGVKDLSDKQKALNLKCMAYEANTGHLYMACTESWVHKRDVILRL